MRTVVVLAVGGMLVSACTSELATAPMGEPTPSIPTTTTPTDVPSPDGGPSGVAAEVIESAALDEAQRLYPEVRDLQATLELDAPPGPRIVVTAPHGFCRVFSAVSEQDRVWTATEVHGDEGLLCPDVVSPGPREGVFSCGDLADADLDGDGRTDELRLERPDDLGDWTLVVETSRGGRGTIPVTPAAEGFFVLDIEGDGRDEIFVGGTTVYACGAEIVRWTGGRLVKVVDTAGEPFWLWSGGGGDWDSVRSGWKTMDRVGCDDLDGDGIRELVTYHAEHGAGTVTLERVGYRITGGTAVEVDRQTSTHALLGGMTGFEVFGLAEPAGCNQMVG